MTSLGHSSWNNSIQHHLGLLHYSNQYDGTTPFNEEPGSLLPLRFLVSILWWSHPWTLLMKWKGNLRKTVRVEEVLYKLCTKVCSQLLINHRASGSLVRAFSCLDRRASPSHSTACLGSGPRVHRALWLTSGPCPFVCECDLSSEAKSSVRLDFMCFALLLSDVWFMNQQPTISWGVMTQALYFNKVLEYTEWE